jgi:electron transfer flavoprotein beta subunit
MRERLSYDVKNDESLELCVKLLVCVKNVERLTDEIELKLDGRDVVPDKLDTAVNASDLTATEEALRLRDEIGGEVLVATCGDESAEHGLRRALAMGADRGIRVDAKARDPLSVAHALAPLVAAEQPDLVLCGAQSSDSVQAATGTMLASLARLPCAAVIRRIDYDGPNRRAVVERELESGALARMAIDLPAVLTIQAGINRPRYANLRAVKRAEAAQVHVRQPDALPSPAYVVRRMFPPTAGRRAELLKGDPTMVALRLTEIVRERLG